MSVLPRRLVLPVALVGVLAGCSSGRSDAVQTAVESFRHALDAQRGAQACELLSPGARSEVASTTGEPCARGILRVQLPELGSVTSTEVWGDEAQVRTGTDTVFLSRYDHGWKVVAAGCTQQPGEPYDCELQGA